VPVAISLQYKKNISPVAQQPWSVVGA